MIWNVFQQTHLRIILGEAKPNTDLADRISSSLNFCSNLKQNLDSTPLHSLKKLSDFSFKRIYFFFLLPGLICGREWKDQNITRKLGISSPAKTTKLWKFSLKKIPVAVIKPSPAFLLFSKLPFSCMSHLRIQGIQNWVPGVGQTPKRYPYFQF